MFKLGTLTRFGLTLQTLSRSGAGGSLSLPYVYYNIANMLVCQHTYMLTS
jgi:hypothetical protein